jgi:hypothetical protein
MGPLLTPSRPPKGQNLIGRLSSAVDPDIKDTKSSMNDNLFEYFMNRNNVTTIEEPSS